MLESEEVIPIKKLDGDTSKLIVFYDIKIDSRHMNPSRSTFHSPEIATAIVSILLRVTTTFLKHSSKYQSLLSLPWSGQQRYSTDSG